MAAHYLLLFLSVIQACLAQTSIVNGRAVYSGTPVSTNAYGVPTLVYNCAMMPAICNNVHRRNPLKTYGRYKGELQGASFIELNFDTDNSRKNKRRDGACPASWKRTHSCPEVDQPPTVKKDLTVATGWRPARYNPNNLAMGASGHNRIANSRGQDSNMIWTCDEWPPASTVEGGPGQARTYCAPQSGSCSGGPGERSEQDWQATAHSFLRMFLDESTKDPDGVYLFHFKTEFVNDRRARAAYVSYIEDPNGQSEKSIGVWSRSDEPPHVVTTMVHANGTSSVQRRPLTENEKAISTIRRRTGDNITDTTDEGQGVNVAHQAFESLHDPPILPFFDISRTFLRQQAKLPVLSYFDQFAASALNNTRNIVSGIFDHLPTLPKRDSQGAKQCGPGSPCPDGSCCNNEGGCGYGPENCGAGNCTSNCDAKALCGRDSEGGNVSCPLNVCCSYYGYCNTDADFCSSSDPNAPCQQGFGSCNVVSPPSCGGDSSSGRSIAYYQVANIRERACNRITPSQINTTGLTHLYLAFASIDPKTYEIIPGDDDDADIYPEFTGLQSSSLQTWIAIGGWDFNDAGSTQNTWSDLASTEDSRSTFISSLKTFMDRYGFQGVDLDWEYPGAPDRHGQEQDTQNFVSLVREMRSAFGSNYGISATLPASYWYLRWFDPKAMEPFVDFFGLMTYDLHGPWDANVKSIGQVVYGQTNIPEIANWTLPLWYDGVDPSKLNLGLAYYGRGYTLSDQNCNSIGCNWTGPSRPGPCTNFGGVMSLQELDDIVIPALGVQPTLLKDEMMKQLTWGNQWIGYDDLETIAMKKQWASSHCFGGTMIWSIDLFSGAGSGDTPDGKASSTSSDPGAGGGQQGSSENANSTAMVYIDPSIWEDPEPVVQCQPPCTMVLPPLVLPTTTTISFPLLTTSLDVAWSESTGWTSTLQTTTLTIPPVTTTAIDVWQQTITSSPSISGWNMTTSFYVTSSIRPPPFTITDDPNPQSITGVTHEPVTRTITAPPYPYSFEPPEHTPWPTATTSSSTDGGVLFPLVTFKPGPPGPTCTEHCGSPCLLFCDYPCLLDCPNQGNDFADPVNPNPPDRPTPTPPSEPEITGPTITPPPDPSATSPANEEEEELDQECALEYGLPLPTYSTIPTVTVTVDTRPTVTVTTTVRPPPPPPSPSPPPPPDPPKPNPDTEEVHCYKTGTFIPRKDAINAINRFCGGWSGTTLDASVPDRMRTLHILSENTHPETRETLVSATVINGCRFEIDGPSPEDECGRILREAIDQCDTFSTQYKHGGTIKSNCAQWKIEPGHY